MKSLFDNSNQDASIPQIGDGCIRNTDGTWQPVAVGGTNLPRTDINLMRNPAYDGPMGIFEGYGEYDDE